MSLFNEDALKVIQAEEEELIRRHTILIVDDEEYNLSTLHDLLHDEYHVLTATDGQEALELVQKTSDPSQIHLIISDQRMPRMTGVEFLKRTIPIIPKTVRMILTGFTDIDVIIDSINEGQIYKFITKPFENLDLKVTVRRALELFELEDQNIILRESNRRLTELNQTKKQLLHTLFEVYENELQTLESIQQAGIEGQQDPQESLQEAMRETLHIKDAFRPIISLYFSERAIRNHHVLLAETNRKQQLVAKMALGGTGVALDIAPDLETAIHLLETEDYDIVCMNEELIELAEQAYKKSQNIQTVFMTSGSPENYINTLFEYPFLSNIVSWNEDDRTFTLKNILTTVSKLINDDLFGLEKYLNWGVEVRQHAVTHSKYRGELVENMHSYFGQLGVRKGMLSRCEMVAEELLMNAVYDAPADIDGIPLYNHLPRTTPVKLKRREQGLFRYACDGLVAALSVEDPFGAFERQTILEYLKSCYEAKENPLHQNKGGAGRGLFQIMETADLVVFNVRAKVRTEVIALFNIDPSIPKTRKTTSFHYFFS